MKSELSCIFQITRKQYGYMISRLQPFNIKLHEKRHYQISIMKSGQQAKKNPQKKVNYIQRKYQSNAIRLRDPNFTTYLFTNGVSTFSQKFFFEAYYLRTDNNMKEIIKNWPFFEQLKETSKGAFQSQVYHWGKVMQIQFIDLSRDNEQVLLIMTDYNSIIVNNSPDKTKIQPQVLRNKFVTNFKDVYSVLSNTYNQSNSQVVMQLLAQQIQPQSTKPGYKYVDFESRSLQYAQKLVLIAQRSNGGFAVNQGSSSYNNPSMNTNPVLKSIYWMGRASQIIQFFITNQLRLEQASNKQKQNVLQPRQEIRVQQSTPVRQQGPQIQRGEQSRMQNQQRMTRQ